MNGVTGTRPNAPFVGKVPTKRATVDEIENDLPNYATEPNVWEHAMRPRMYTVLKAHGIASPTVTTPIITAALAAAKEKKPGDVRTAWQMLSKYRRAALREQRVYAAEKRRISEIRDWLIGPCGLPTPTVREMMRQSGTELQDRPLIERITDITMMAIDRQFNAHGQNKKHWAANYANPPVADFWQHVTNVAEAKEWSLQERIGKLNIALGSVASIYWYPGTLDQARAAFDKTYCDKGDETMVAPAKDYATNPVAARYAIPAHMAKGLNVTENEIGTHVVKCFGGQIDKYIDQHGPEQALKTADDYILKLNAKPAADIKPADPDGSRADFANITADRTPHIGDDSAEAPERQSKPVDAPKPVATHPDSVSATAKQGQAFLTVEKAIVETSDKTEKRDEIRRKYNMKQRGNDYLMVQGRVLLMRLDHPEWAIETDTVMLTETIAVFKATVRNDEGHIVATGHGRATEAGTKNLGGRYIEKAETAAIGRALALSGYGTDDTLEDGDYLADSPVTKAA